MARRLIVPLTAETTGVVIVGGDPQPRDESMHESLSAMVDHAPVTRRRRSVLAVVTLGLATVAFLAAVGTWCTGHLALDQVQASSGIPRCTGTTVGSARWPNSIVGSAAHRVSSIPMKAGFQCDLTILVHNGSSRQIRLDQITVPVGGPTASSLEVTTINGIAVPYSGETRAIVDPKLTIPAHEDEVLMIQVRYRNHGCTSEDSSLTSEPGLALSALTASRALDMMGFPLFEGTPDTSCDG